MAITLVAVVVILIVVPLQTYLLYLPAMQLMHTEMDDAPAALIYTQRWWSTRTQASNIYTREHESMRGLVAFSATRHIMTFDAIEYPFNVNQYNTMDTHRVMFSSLHQKQYNSTHTWQTMRSNGNHFGCSNSDTNSSTTPDVPAVFTCNTTCASGSSSSANIHTAMMKQTHTYTSEQGVYERAWEH